MNSKVLELRITNYVLIINVILLVLSSNVFQNRLTLK